MQHSQYNVKKRGVFMNIRECYEKLNGDYEDVISRLGSDSLTEKFVNKFLNDRTYDLLKQAVSTGDIHESFRAAHTLKGVAANLSFTEPYDNASKLTEQLRPLTEPADEELLSDVDLSYSKVISVITDYFNNKH